VPDNFKVNLTPSRWEKTGWKYDRQHTDYFEHEYKKKNTLGYSVYKLNDIRQLHPKYKTNYMLSFKDNKYNTVDHNDTVQEKGLPNTTNCISECYPVIPGGERSAAKYQKVMQDIIDARRKTMNANNSTSISTASKNYSPKEHERHHSHNKNGVRVNLMNKYEQSTNESSNKEKKEREASKEHNKRHHTHRRHHHERKRLGHHRRHHSTNKAANEANNGNYFRLICSCL